MKKLLLFFLLAWSTQGASAQIVAGGVNLQDLDLQYIEVYPASGLGGVVRINYGLVNNNIFIQYDPLIDAEGKTFRNTIAALNYLHQYGWEVFLTPLRNGDESSPAYLMKRKER